MATFRMLRQATPMPVITAAAQLVKAVHPTNGSLHRALDRAAVRLQVAPWHWDATSDVLAIQSQSHPAEVHYASADVRDARFHTEDDQPCTCPCRRGHCQHVAAALICQAIAGIGRLPTAALPLRSSEDAADLDGRVIMFPTRRANNHWCSDCGQPFDLPMPHPRCSRCQARSAQEDRREAA